MVFRYLQRVLLRDYIILSKIIFCGEFSKLKYEVELVRNGSH